MIKTLVRWVLFAVFMAGAAMADPLPAGWSSADVGVFSPAGTQSYTPATSGFSLAGAGSDIWGTADQFHYAYQSWTGDGQWIVQVSSVQNTNAWAKAGIMVRADLTAGSANVLLALTPGNGLTFQRRKTSGGASVYNSIPSATAPGWIKLVRRGDQFDTYTSTDGQAWTYWMTDFVSLPAAVQVGLAVTSHHAGVLASASFTQFSANLVATGSLPTGWTSADVGAPTPMGDGGYTSAATRFDLIGAGTDIWGTTDQFHYVYEPWTGDGQWIVQLSSVQNTSTWAKAGIMVRENLSAGSRHAMLVLTPGNGVAFQRRKVADGSSLNTNVVGMAAPGWLKLVRRGNQFDSYTSSDGQTWAYWMTDIINMPAAVQVGLALTSHHTGVLAGASFSHFDATAPLPADFLSTWTSQDIGGPALAGMADYEDADGLLTLRGAGADIWGTADQCQFAYTPWTGNAVLVSRVESLQNTSSWAKAGVMIRASLDAGAAQALVALTPGNGVAFQRRTTTGGSSLNTAIAGVATPGWVKLERWGDRFDGFYSTDGLTWNYLGSQTIVMPSAVYIGLAVTSHNANALAKAEFSHLTYNLTGAPGGLWGQYYSGKVFNTPVLQRLDDTVNFTWGAGSPASAVPVDNFSARWTGWVVPDVTQAYTFYTVSDDGVRLWVNNQLLIDNWTNHGGTTNSGTVTLNAGTAYSIKMEYYENTGSATAQLQWSATDRGKTAIPAPFLIPSQYPNLAGDGLPDYWKSLHGLDVNTAINPNAIDPATVDAQGNGGLTYLQEYGNSISPLITILGGDQQTSYAGLFNANPFDVAVWKSDGSGPLVNTPVTFTVTSGGGLLAATSTTTPPLSASIVVNTDQDGTAQAYYQHSAVSGVTSQIKATAGISHITFITNSISVPVPENPLASAVSQTQINLSWSGDSSATSYTIERQATDGSYQVIATVDNALSYSDTGLSAGQTYHYRIKAKTNGATSDYSVTIAATTTAETNGQPPVVSLSIDYTQSSFAEPGSISLSAAATSPTSTIAKVEFYSGATKIGTSTGAPYQFAWTNIPAGTFVLTSVATDANGLTTASTPQWVNIDAPSLPPLALPYTTDFEASGNYLIGHLDHQNSWIVNWVSTGGVTVTNTDSFSGSQAIEIKPDPLSTNVTQNFASDPSISVVYVDFYAKPAANDDPNVSSQFWTESAGISLKRTGNLGEINVYNADINDWVGTGVTVPLNGNGQASDWIRFTIRADYGASTWDLYINGHLLVEKVPAYYNTNFTQFIVYGSDSASTFLDAVSAGYTNPLFADVNNDGIADDWEQSNGLSLSASNRDGVQANGLTNLQAYLNANAVLLGFNSTPPMIALPDNTPPVITSLVDASGVPGPYGLIAVRITGANGAPIPNASVTFTIMQGGDFLGGNTDSALTEVVIASDSDGYAQTNIFSYGKLGQDIVSVTAQNPNFTSVSSSISIAINPPAIMSFGSDEGYVLGALGSQRGWSVVQGSASVTNVNEHWDGQWDDDSVVLSAGVPPAKVIQTSIPSFPGKDIMYVDFYAQPTAENNIGQSTSFDVGGARFAFVISGSKADGVHATLEAFDGDGQGGGAWVVNRSDVVLYDGVTPGWVELSVRLNYSTKTWDLYLNQHMVAADLSFVDKGNGSLTSFAVTGDSAHDSFIDQIYVGSANPLFQDFNNDGIDDSWEASHGLSLTGDDRYVDRSGNGLTVLTAYVEGGSPNDFFQQQPPVITLVDAVGALGAQGLVAVKVTNIYGNVFKNGTVDLALLSPSRLSFAPGGVAGSIQTDSNGIAEVYLNSAPSNGPYQMDSSSGLPGWWQNLYFGATGQSPDANPSGDGMSNWYKYQMGLNPNINEDAADLDGDGVPNDRDARPKDSSVGILRIQITVPANGGTVQ